MKDTNAHLLLINVRFRACKYSFKRMIFCTDYSIIVDTYESVQTRNFSFWQLVARECSGNTFYIFILLSSLLQKLAYLFIWNVFQW